MNRAVVYYSLSGNTKEAAKVIARKLGAKIFEIDLVKPLPKNTVRQMIVGGMQSTFGRRPKIKGVPDNIDYYDEIILGMPVWAGMPASPVNTFIKITAWQIKLMLCLHSAVVVTMTDAFCSCQRVLRI